MNNDKIQCWKRFKSKVITAYRWTYYGPLRCARPFRLAKYLPGFPVPGPIVCERSRLVYYFIPKTGCTTIKSLILEAEARPVPDVTEEIHVQADKLIIPKSTLNLQLSRYNGYLKFAFVRNPWARLVSCYLNKVVALRPGTFKEFSYRYPHVRFDRVSFTGFVRFVCRVPDDLCEPHFKPQSAFFDDKDVDFIGRFERFPDELAQVIERAELDQRFLKYCRMRKMKSATGKPYTDHYTAETRRLVAEKYKDDIQRFGYRFGE